MSCQFVWAAGGHLTFGALPARAPSWICLAATWGIARGSRPRVDDSFNWRVLAVCRLSAILGRHDELTGGFLESRLSIMHKFEVVFATHAPNHPIEALFTYAASRRAAAAWAEDWAGRRGWQVASVTVAGQQKQHASSYSTRNCNSSPR